MKQTGFAEISIGSRTDVGRVRGNNEDACRVVPEIKLFIVSDGMGGQSHGEVASAIAVATIAQYCSAPPTGISSYSHDQRVDLSEKTNCLISAVRLANRQIYQAGIEDPAMRGMGATVVAAWLENFRLSLVHVGDSRAYLLRAGTLTQLTVDHTWVAEQIRAGLIKPEEAHLSKIQNILIRALGAHENVELDASECMLANDDIVVLCTDGLTRLVSDPEIARALMECPDVQTSADRLILMANERGGEDNITVVILHINPVSSTVSFRIDGKPPAPQTVRVTANQPVTITRLELLLPNGQCASNQECSFTGSSIEIPLSQDCVAELFKAPRPTGSTYDSSFTFRVTASAGGETRAYTFRAQVSVVVVGGTVYHCVSGSRDFL